MMDAVAADVSVDVTRHDRLILAVVAIGLVWRWRGLPRLSVPLSNPQLEAVARQGTSERAGIRSGMCVLTRVRPGRVVPAAADRAVRSRRSVDIQQRSARRWGPSQTEG
jgi:hypothetical protein